MIKSVTIHNFKSITNLTLPLTRVNVLIGANGSGKSNILEALAMVPDTEGSATLSGLRLRGMRLARPDLMVSSFYGMTSKEEIRFDYVLDNNHHVLLTAKPENEKDIYTPWKFSSAVSGNVSRNFDQEDFLGLLKYINKYTIYSPNVDALRGLTMDSNVYPIGLHGEGLDVFLSQLEKTEIIDVIHCINKYIDWVGDVIVEKSGESLKMEGYKLGRSKSNLYFTDKFMQKKNMILSAENANEGALVLLFQLALLASKRTPNFFAIDNIDTALNPRLCRELIKEVTNFALKNNKQVVVTTQNPAVLDGMDLNSENQSLNVVSRNDEGRTVIKQIRTKRNSLDSTSTMKLSEMWTNGLLGGLPENF